MAEDISAVRCADPPPDISDPALLHAEGVVFGPSGKGPGELVIWVYFEIGQIQNLKSEILKFLIGPLLLWQSI